MNSNKTILVLYKDDGKFYKAKGFDAIILNYLFGYQIINNRVGFPDTAIDKVREELDKEEISYQIVYNDINPLFVNFDNNKYLDILNKANKVYDYKLRIDKICERLSNLDNNELDKILSKIENIIEGL